VSESAALADSELVFVGYGVEAPEFKWDDYKGVDLKGKTMVVLINDPPLPDEKMFGGKAMTYYGRWTYKFETGAKKGAAGILIVHETIPAGYPFSVIQSSSGERFDLVTPDKNMSRASVEGWVSLDRAKQLFTMAGQDFDALKARAATREFKPVPLGVTASVQIKNKLRTLDSRNVVAKLEGSDPKLKDEYVVYTAHWDHLGIGPEVKGDKIYNGALDNATGTAGLIEIARAFRQVKPAPKRSILFLAVTAEEQGLLGSLYYAVTPIYPLTKTLANMNIDGMNVLGRTKDVTVIGMGASDLDDYLKAAATEQGRTLKPDPESEKGFYYRSDHFNFAKQGVPALYIDDGTEFVGKPPDYGMKMRERYNKEDYHAPSDEVKPDWDLSGAAEDAQLFFIVGYRVANAATFPEWKPGNEFRAVRERQLRGTP
jgi:Zn-dependent M28 family amino/carboxypeptidase